MDNIVELIGSDLTYIAAVINTAVENGQRVRIHTDSRGLYIARAGGMWTLPFGKSNQ